MTAFVTSSKLQQLADKSVGNKKELVFPKVVSSIYDVEKGTLFVAKKDSRYDGHQFIEAAVEGGAAGALWHIDEPVPATLPDDFPLFMSPDPEGLCRELAVQYLNDHRADVVFVEGDYTASILLRVLKAWTGGRRTAFIKEQESRGTETAEIVLSLDIDTEIVFIEAVESSVRMYERASLLQPDIALISYYSGKSLEEADILEGTRETIRISVNPPMPNSSDLNITPWIESYRPLLEAASQVYRMTTENTDAPVDLLTPETFGYQTLNTKAAGLVLFEAEAMEQADLDYALGWLSHIQPYERRILVIDEGFQADRTHKSVHELFAGHITTAVTDVFSIGEKAFWVHDALERSGREDLISRYYKTHIEAMEDLREAMNGPNVMLYKGANRALIYEILNELNRE
ncbi:MAG: hypothetical protein EA344_09280 [Alkalicoccus sp.]|nr:MAG: hypothetical protein EA344_09280 [Alkalicoccus sp.]